MNYKEKKEFVKNYINFELCEIIEDFVYLELFINYNKCNELFQLNEGWIREYIYSDKEFCMEVVKCKFFFMMNVQVLFYGDLYIGFVFVRDDFIKVIDFEFVFYGFMGYDVGNVMVNLMFVWVNVDVMMLFGVKKDIYMDWL